MKMNWISKGEEGFVLVAAIVFIIMLVLLALFILNAGYNQRVMGKNVGVTRAKVYYRAQAGVVDANARIRTNYVTNLVADTAHGSTGTDFLDPNYNPESYNLDLDSDPPELNPASGYDVTVDISAVNKNNDGTDVNPATGRRIIEATGKDTG